MASTTGKVLSQWSYKVTVEFASLPLEKEEAYWAAIHYLASVLFDMDTENTDTSSPEILTYNQINKESHV
jgi:hypothetical protein